MSSKRNQMHLGSKLFLMFMTTIVRSFLISQHIQESD